ncbi:cupin-like domain-containing protein [Blastococcus sp. TML/M2B]|uniref:cupin domain-containing protein n=1 Tax=unclassified Blastococcus TaxID=2619396 RepID=UPI00190BB8D3|nr:MULTISPECIES: cupin domain-containing protein [unclassified Blastococcus]MBN1092406.1 cupin-like domain-containing protein [Blastococcus sp. TML/M2B]MBN1097500.1 cupin-like domain-containing protein [Blastococcus sp. TML/C7B]
MDPAPQGRAEQPLRPALRRCTNTEPEVFAREHWGRHPLLTRAADTGNTFTDLLDLAAVDELLSRRGLRTPFLRIAKDGQVVDPKRFTTSGGAGAEVADQVSSDAVLRLFAEGSTVVLQGLHRLWPPLIEFADQLAADLGHPTQVNAYVTPPSSRGFDPHYDVHDVFVLQVAGQKHWTIHEPVLRDPLRTQVWTDRREDVAAAATREPVVDAVLEPGDVLYLPRGFLHSATALGEISAHLTIGVHSVTRWGAAEAALDLLRSLAAEDPALRGSLPLGVDLARPDSIRDHVATVIAGLQEWLGRVDPDEIAEQLRARTWAQVRPEPVAPLAQATAAAALTADTVLRLRPRLRCALRDGDDGRVTLVGGRRTHTFPSSVRDALTELLAVGELKVGDLPGLAPEDRITLARRLVTESVAVVPDAVPGS